MKTKNTKQKRVCFGPWLNFDWIKLNWIELANEQKRKTKHFETIVSENDGTKLVSHFLCLKSDYSVCLEVLKMHRVPLKTIQYNTPCTLTHLYAVPHEWVIFSVN